MTNYRFKDHYGADCSVELDKSTGLISIGRDKQYLDPVTHQMQSSKVHLTRLEAQNMAAVVQKLGQLGWLSPDAQYTEQIPQ